MKVIIKPIISEKSTDQQDKLNRFGFVVDKKAKKLQIKDAVEELYNVKVAAVNTMVYSGKEKTRYTKSGLLVGRTNAYKKALVTLVDGDTIDFYSNI